MKRSITQKGIAHLWLLLLIVIVAAAIGLVALRVVKKQNSSQQEQKSGSQKIQSKSDLEALSKTLEKSAKEDEAGMASDFVKLDTLTNK